MAPLGFSQVVCLGNLGLLRSQQWPALPLASRVVLFASWRKILHSANTEPGPLCV